MARFRVARCLALALAGVASVWLAASCDGGGRADSYGRGTPESFARPAGDAVSGDTAAEASPGDPLVVFFGDSITAGLHHDPEQAFPALVQRRLAAEGLAFRLVNAGVSGDTSAGGLRRIDWVLRQEPDVLVLELGGNDGLRGQPVAEIEERLREIARHALDAGARVLLLGVRLPPSLGRDYVSSFEELYPRLAEELGCAYLPFFMRGAALDPNGMLDDRIHPSGSGHERIAADVVPALRLVLEELGASAR